MSWSELEARLLGDQPKHLVSTYNLTSLLEQLEPGALTRFSIDVVAHHSDDLRATLDRLKVAQVDIGRPTRKIAP